MPASHAEIWAALALLPLIFYANALSRGKAAPKLRSAYTPYVLLALCLVSVYASGGLRSPLFGVYGLLTLCVAALAGLMPALALAGIVTAIEGLLAHKDNSELSLAPLALPWAGLIFGRFMGVLRGSAGPAAETQSAPARPRAAAPASVEALPEVNIDAQIARSAASLLDLAHHAHPNWNALLLLWKEGAGLRCKQGRARSGELNLDFNVESGDGLIGWALRDKKPVKIGELAATAAAALPYYVGEVKAKALLATPFFDEGELLGVLVVDRAEPGEWSPDELMAAEYLGRQVVQQSQQAGAFGRLQAQGGQVRELYEISKELSDDMDRDGLVARFPSLLSRLLHFDSFYLAMREDEGDFAVLASQGYGAAFTAAYKLDDEAVLGGWVLTSGEPLAYNASHAEAQVPQFLKEGLEAEAGAFLLVPMLRKHRVIGLLKLDRASGAFSEADKEIALIFATQAAGTLDNARLYSLHQRMATTDGLTGLYNHRYFQERLAHEITVAKRTGKPLSLALTDIDFFKKFNDSFGHQEGDNVLKKCAKLLRDTVRQGKDVVCRYGGEEFVIILPDCDLVEAREAVEKVRQACADTLIGGHGPEARAITLSIGLCSYPLGATEQREIIHKADEALYKAKQTGRNRTCSFKDLP